MSPIEVVVDSSVDERFIQLECDREPIHIPGRIQPFGLYIALTRDWRVSHVSANIGEFTGKAPEKWLGQHLLSVIEPMCVHDLRNHASTLHGPDAIQRAFAVTLIEGVAPFDIAIHCVGESIIIEAEPAVTDEREAAALVRAMVGRLKHSSGLHAFFRDGARHVQALTGFDRVMVYRFESEGHGEVIAECLRGDQESYLGLHYPASDIPTQARALYLRNPFRIIVDVEAETVPIEAALDAPTTLIDQSLSVLRAVSPVHIEYLKNMKVAASLSISIIVNGQLWGLFACHHRAPRLPSFAYRTAAELFGEMFSMMLESRLRREAADHELRDRALATLLLAEIEHDASLFAKADRLGELLFDTIPADGLWVHVDGKSSLIGKSLDDVQCAQITAILATRAPRSVFATDALDTFLPAHTSDETIAGVLAIPLMRHPNDYLLLFRCERLRTMRWAGDPAKPVAGLSRPAEISPRQSFAAWEQLIQGKSEPFTVVEQHAAEAIRVTLVEAMLRTTGNAPYIPDEIGVGKDVLIAELNHRVRNILALIKGLITQTRDSSETSENFITTLDERVQSLARAHDQVTNDRWGPAPLQDLIETEASAYLNGLSSRVEVSGPNILVHPAAFTTLALVFHELMTNAVKYGALSALGKVLVEWREEEDGDLAIEWSERGGPPVSVPKRRGFGSIIIDRSIPFDLGGSSTIEYLSSGVRARFRVPMRHIAGLLAAKAITKPASSISRDYQPLAGLCVLLVEDSLVIALDCERILRELGAHQVTTASSTAEALVAIAADVFQFALLDFNLGVETSSVIADELASRDIPFAFATGYDGETRRLAHLNVPVIGKPYGKMQLIPLLMDLGVMPPS